MLQASRLLRPLAALGIVGASLVGSVTIFAVGAKSTGESATSQSVGESAVANRAAARTGVTVTVDDPPSPPASNPPAPGVAAFEARVLELVNAERTVRGLRPVTLDARLNQASEVHSVHQAEIGTIFHVAPDGTTPGDRIRAAGYVFAAWAENVAAGQTTPEAVVAAWIASPGHCKNMLNPTYVHMGVGYVETSTSYRHWWTQKFARPMGDPVPPGTFDPSWC